MSGRNHRNAPAPLFTFASQCQHKVKFTRKEAARKAEEWRQRQYRCAHCGGWHLTSQRTQP